MRKPIIGFVGLGTMGKWMGLNIIKAEFPLQFYARRQEVITEMMNHGAKACSSVQDLAKSAEWIILCLPDTTTVGEILFGKEGMAEVLQAGQIVIDCGTIHPLKTREFAHDLKKKGVIFLDAPVSGMEARAKAGTLTIMVGGEEAAFQQIKPVLEAMGNIIIYAGPTGNGQMMKLINQIMFNVHCAAIAELLPLAVKMGLDPAQTITVARTGTGQCFALDNFGPLILKRDFGPGYPLADAYKDMVHIAEISSLNRIPLPVTAAATLTYQMALDQELGRENKGAMIKVWEKLLGVEVRETAKQK